MLPSEPPTQAPKRSLIGSDGKWHGFGTLRKRHRSRTDDDGTEAPMRKRAKVGLDGVGDELQRINSAITEVEKEIANSASEFKKVRMAMLTGILSLDGLEARNKLDELTETLKSLKTKREAAMTKMDEYILLHMKEKEEEQGDDDKDDDAPDKPKVHHSKVPDDTNLVCKNGCKDLIFDRTNGIDICTVCGTTFDHSFDLSSDYLSYDESKMYEMPRRRGGGYKPPNHFAEILAQFQGRRRSCAPKHIVDLIGDYCKRYHIESHKITPQVVRGILKQKQQEESTLFKWAKTKPKRAQCKYTDYYKHCPEIAWRLSGIPPPYMTPSQEDRIVALFPMAIEAYCTSPRYLTRKKNRINRKKENPNNANYFWILYKLCQTLGFEEFLPYIPLPKSLANIEDCDINAWRHICHVNGWFYIPTK